jgi:tripartite-type tricarboxylate transporter receptor subunit TctC
MNRRDALKLFTLLATPLSSIAEAWGQKAWAPAGAVKMVVPFSAGGPLDLYARAIDDRLSQRIGQPVVPDYRPGAGQAIAGDFVRRQAPDGLTLFIVTTSFLVNSLLTPVPFNPLDDFAPLIHLGDADLIIAVNNAKVKCRTPEEFIEWAKSNKEGALYGIPNRGGGGNLVGELINSRAGLSMQSVAYRGSAPMMIDLIAGNIGVIIETVGTVRPFLDTNQITIIANCSSRRNPDFPDVPTLAETVLPDFDLRAWYGILMPAKTPAPILERYNSEIQEILKDPAVVDLFARNSLSVTGGTPEAFKNMLQSSYALYKKIIAEAKISLQ